MGPNPDQKPGTGEIRHMSDILIIVPPSYKLPGRKGKGENYYNKKADFPTGAVSIASHLRELGFEAKVLCADLFPGPTPLPPETAMDILCPVIEQENPAYLGFSITYKIQERYARTMLRICKTRFPEIPLILGGAHVSVAPRAFSGTDTLIIRGEGEKAVEKILKNEDISRIHQRAGHQKLAPAFFTPRLRPEEIPVLDIHTLVSPAQTHSGDGTVCQPGTTRISSILDFNIHLPLSRGCGYSCAFCVSPHLWSKGVFRVPLEKTEKQLQILYDQGVRNMDLEDDIINLDSSYFRELTNICRGFKAMRFGVMSRVDRLFEKNLLAMKACGMDLVYVGVESTRKEILSAMKKELHPEDIRGALVRAKRCGLRVGVFLIFGHPGATKELDMQTVHDIKQLIREGLIREVSHSVFAPLPGSLSAEDSRIVFLDDVQPEDWGTIPVFRLVDENTKVIYHEKEMQEVMDAMDGVLASFGISNKTTLPEHG